MPVKPLRRIDGAFQWLIASVYLIAEVLVTMY
jgi:hypothetical protein